jgi:hypothetical protein
LGHFPAKAHVLRMRIVRKLIIRRIQEVGV